MKVKFKTLTEYEKKSNDSIYNYTFKYAPEFCIQSKEGNFTLKYKLIADIKIFHNVRDMYTEAYYPNN